LASGESRPFLDDKSVTGQMNGSRDGEEQEDRYGGRQGVLLAD
jgi:hypothetical protein